MTAVRTAEERRLLGAFEAVTDVSPVTCVIDDDFDRAIYVVPPDDMGRAIGTSGDHVERIEDRIDRAVEVVADAATAEDFVANALAPAPVRNVTVSENGDVVAYVEVPHEDRGLAIGTDGRTVARARRLVDRRFDVDDVQFT